MSENASRSNQPDERFGLVQGDRAPQATVADTRDLMDLYRKTYGFPTEIFDLAVDEFSERRLSRSSYAGVVRIALNPGLVRHPAIRDLVASRLAGRDPNVTLDEEFLCADFQMEDGSYENQMLAADFAFTLALLIDGIPERVSVSPYRGPELEGQQSPEPPSR